MLCYVKNIFHKIRFIPTILKTTINDIHTLFLNMLVTIVTVENVLMECGYHKRYQY